MPLYRFNIRLKLILLLILLVLSIIFISTFASYFRDSKNLQSQIQKYGIVMTEIFTQMAAAHIFEMDFVTVLEDAQRLINSSDVQSVTIIDVNGRIWISTKSDEMDSVAIPRHLKAIADSGQLDYRKIRKDGEEILEFINPVTILGKVSHLVMIEISLESMQTQLSERMQNILVLSFVLTILAIALAIVFSRLLTDPLKKLVSGTNEISQGHLDYRIEVDSEDEIGELSKSFNLMADNLQSELLERKQAQ